MEKDSIWHQIGKELGKWANEVVHYIKDALWSIHFYFIQNYANKKDWKSKHSKDSLQNGQSSFYWIELLLCFKHNYDIVIGPVADAFVEQEIAKYKAAFKANYMEEDSLKEFASRISQFGNEYIQYCFCTQRAIDELIKE